ncbi:MAG: DNA mismatch repair protein MutS [Bdellovibrionota bacterium]
MAKESTPLMRQYHEVKSRFPDSLLFFRMGDFYELFFEDAKIAAKALEIALTSRNRNDPDPVPMCGVPHHAATNYVNRLVNSGHKVAICEQLEDPAMTKGIVKRDVIRVVSPGTRLDLEALEAKAPNFTHAAVLRHDEVVWATCDYTTGKFWFGFSSSAEEWLAYAQAQGLSELLFSDQEKEGSLFELWRENAPQTFAQRVPSFYFENEYGAERIREQFSAQSLSAIHPELQPAAGAVGALIKYFQETQKAPRIPSVIRVERWGSQDSMELDSATIRALELLPQQNRNYSLLHWLDRTKTAMGGRLLREWILRPLTSRKAIETRLDQVESLLESFSKFHPLLQEIYDLERLISRVSLGQGAVATPRDLFNLASSIEKSIQLHDLMSREGNKGLSAIETALAQALGAELISLTRETLAALAEVVPFSAREGGVFRRGFHIDLDELIELSQNGEQWLADFEARERKATGITSLKVRFNRVFGYYIEITKANLKAVPEHYIRKQTMVGGERYVTDELKKFEEKILTAEKKRCDMEYALFREFCSKFTELATSIIATAKAVAHLDVACSLAEVAIEDEYVRPKLEDSLDLEIEEGRHPTVSVMLNRQLKSNRFVPNTVHLSGKHPFLLITGPNMGGKSTVMRQTALIALLAQIGSFVPAKSSRIGIVDRIFTRIGANDNTSEGSSTFMVEMSEMSFILRHATKRSLILIDEIGRGTSTYDGMSLAWALAREIADKIRARTLFATHYHELTQLADDYSTVVNARVAVAVGPATGGMGSAAQASDSTGHDSHHHPTIKFLYRLESGVAERSYGILVARLAGLSPDVLSNAQTLLEQLEAQARTPGRKQKNDSQLFLNLARKRKSGLEDKNTLDAHNEIGPATESSAKSPVNPSSAMAAELQAWLESVRLDELTPLQAMVQLAEWKQKMTAAKSRLTQTENTSTLREL